MSSAKNLQLAQHLTQIEAHARAATNLVELGFSIANDSYSLLGFRQALVFKGDDVKASLLTVSGLVKPTEGSPYLVWLKRAWQWLFTQVQTEPVWIQFDQVTDRISEDIREGWQEWWPQGLYLLPIKNRQGVILGWVVYLLEAPLQEWQLGALQRLTQTWGYCWEMLAGKPKRGLLQRWRKASWMGRSALVLGVMAVLMLPVRQTVLAPAEVISLDAEVVAAPLDGVVQTVQVRPNQYVKQGELLFSLDDTTLRNRLEVVKQSVAVADAEYIAATQTAFHDSASHSDLAVLSGRAHERRAELAAVQEQLSRVQVRASKEGVAVFVDPDDWLGRPVSTGERIMLLANPDKPGLLIHLPVADALVLEPGAKVKLFLSTKPLSPLEAELIETSYQAMLSPDGISSYRLRAQFAEHDEAELARIGLQGTAKLYGDRVMLGYYIMRRPIAALREWTGW